MITNSPPPEGQQQQRKYPTPAGPNTFQYYDLSAVDPASYAKIHRQIIIARTILIRSNLLLENLTDPIDFAHLFCASSCSDSLRATVDANANAAVASSTRSPSEENNEDKKTQSGNEEPNFTVPIDPADPGATLSISLSLETHMRAIVHAQADAEHIRRLYDAQVEQLEPTVRSQLDAMIRMTLARGGIVLPVGNGAGAGAGNRRPAKLNGAAILACILQIEEILALYQSAMGVHVGKVQIGSTNDVSGQPVPRAPASAVAGHAIGTATGAGAGTGTGTGSSIGTGTGGTGKRIHHPSVPETPLPQPDPFHDTFIVHVVTGCNLFGEISRVQTINLPPDIDWLDFERALSDTTANTWQAVEAGFPCGYEVTYDSNSSSSSRGGGSSHRNGKDIGIVDNGDDDDDDGDDGQKCFWLWIYKGARQKLSLRTPYRKLSSREEFKELKDVYLWEKTWEKTKKWRQLGFTKEEMFEGMIVLHNITYKQMQTRSNNAQALLDRRSTVVTDHNNNNNNNDHNDNTNPEYNDDNDGIENNNQEPTRQQVIAHMHLAFGPTAQSGYAMDEVYGYQGIGGGDSDSSEMDLNVGVADDDEDQEYEEDEDEDEEGEEVVGGYDGHDGYGGGISVGIDGRGSGMMGYGYGYDYGHDYGHAYGHGYGHGYGYGLGGQGGQGGTGGQGGRGGGGGQGQQRRRQRRQRSKKPFFEPRFVWAEYMDTRTR